MRQVETLKVEKSCLLPMSGFPASVCQEALSFPFLPRTWGEGTAPLTQMSMPTGVKGREQQRQKARKGQKQQMAATNVCQTGKDDEKGHK